MTLSLSHKASRVKRIYERSCTFSAHWRKILRILFKLQGPHDASKLLFLMRQKCQLNSSFSSFTFSNKTPARFVSVRFIVTYHPGLSTVPIFIPLPCSQSPSH